jgi:hypothetical protein
LVLRNNGGDDLAVSAIGFFTFATPLASGAAYSVTVLSQPANPAQTCVVTNGSGTMSGATVTNVAITCVTNLIPPGTIHVTVITTGTDAPATYLVRLTGIYDTPGRFSVSVPSNGAVSIAVGGGLYQVRLVVPPNCTVTSPNNIGAFNIVFTVTCVSAGSLRVTVATTGPNAPASYTLGVYPYWGASLYSTPISSNGTATLILPPGIQTVLLVVPPNCTVSSRNNVSVTLLPGATTDLGFTVTCQ